MKDTRIRKASIAKGFISEEKIMNYVIGNNAYGDYKIAEISEEEDGTILIKIKNSANELIDWKRFNASVAVTVEYTQDYDEDFDI